MGNFIRGEGDDFFIDQKITYCFLISLVFTYKFPFSISRGAESSCDCVHAQGTGQIPEKKTLEEPVQKKFCEKPFRKKFGKMFAS